MKEALEKLIAEGLEIIGATAEDFVVEHPVDLSHGDYTTNVALMSAKELGKTPREVASLLAEYIENHKPSDLEVIEIAGPGFINFRLSKNFFKKKIGEILEEGESFGKTNIFSGEKIMVEHTDPNYFKALHIGHYMPMTIGSAVARIFKWNGAEVIEACYYSDVGLQAAKAVWAMKQGITKNPYVVGTKAYDEDENAKHEIVEINKKIYEHSDNEIEKLYREGSEESVRGFNEVYRRFGISFDLYFYESDAAKVGGQLVRKNIGEIFEESDGAVVFHAEKYDPSLHTRVFINSAGLSTYEAKDLGLAKLKIDKYPHTKSVIVTANEQNDYFRVLLAAMRYVLPDLAEKTKHLPHGMLRLPTGKMSSRTGDVITAVSLIEDVKEAIEKKGSQASDEIAVGAIKYMILRQAIGGDIVFDFDKSISTEGDSGVYLQYAYARANSVITKMNAGTTVEAKSTLETDAVDEVSRLEKLLYRFPEVVERAGKEYAPHYITTYLIEIAGAFNSFYAHHQIINQSDPEKTEERVEITKATRQVLNNGLTILGIPVLERM